MVGGGVVGSAINKNNRDDVTRRDHSQKEQLLARQGHNAGLP